MGARARATERADRRSYRHVRDKVGIVGRAPQSHHAPHSLATERLLGGESSRWDPFCGRGGKLVGICELGARSLNDRRGRTGLVG